MNLFLSILVTCLCLPWPVVIMMSPIMVAAQGFASKKSNIVLAMAFFMYPSVVFILVYLIGSSFYGTDALWWAVAFFGLGAIVTLVYDLPAKLYNVSTGIANDGYFIKNNTVYLNGKQLSGADAKTFTQFNNSFYSKDQHQVYYYDKKLKSADAASFQPLANDTSGSYWHDATSAYYKWNHIAGADGSSFQYLGGYYAGDKNHVYLEQYVLAAADRTTFQSLHAFVGKDAKKVFVRNSIATNITDASNFEIITLSEEAFGKDKDHIYTIRYTPSLPLMPFPNADLETFEVIGDYYAKDKHQVYYYSFHIPEVLVLEGANPETFVLHWDGARGSNAQDGAQYYKAGVLVD
jgi:hypothetical protein